MVYNKNETTNNAIHGGNISIPVVVIKRVPSADKKSCFRQKVGCRNVFKTKSDGYLKQVMLLHRSWYSV
jgi:hypothetical protein